MGHRILVPMSALVAAAAVLLAPAAVAAQANKRVAAKAWTAPRTADGQPDLQGLWTNATITPFERPKDLTGKEFFTKEEASAYERQVAENSNRDRRGASAEADVAGAYNDFWFDRGNKVVPTRRTSLVVDPQDGRVPPLTPEAQKAAAARAEISRRPPEGPEDMGLPDRCLLWPTAGPPMLPSGYNNNYQILQVPGYVVILVEMIHDVRIIPLDSRPHLPQHIRQWLGDSRGHWDGNTLVVDTTNFTDKTHFRGADGNLHLIERFTRVDVGTILYEFTVDDPTAFTKPWKAQAPLTKTRGPIYEYACHEGNYSMLNVLKGARAQEKTAGLK
jgi:hypothetical protein